MILNSKLPTVGTTIFAVMSKLAADYNAINLSQGFPDYKVDEELVSYIYQAMKDGNNQYAPMAGVPSLREIIATKTEDFYGAKYNPDTEITITAGGTQAIFTAINAFISAGDEVIIFEPAYDCYSPTIKLLGALVKPFELQAPHYKIDWEIVTKMISAKTKMIIINTPHNPTGTILQKNDIDALIKITKNSDIIILSDEVYEHIIYDNATHHSAAKYPELAERSLIVASFGKLLHATGWKLGYCLAPEKLMLEFRKVHQFNVFSVNTPMQVGIANYLKSSNIFNEIPLFFQEKRDYFRELLEKTKFEILPCNGAYFQCVSYRNLCDENDVNFAERLVRENGVATIPVSAFYSNKIDNKVLRFCFAKENSTLERAVEKLIKL